MCVFMTKRSRRGEAISGWSMRLRKGRGKDSDQKEALHHKGGEEGGRKEKERKDEKEMNAKKTRTVTRRKDKNQMKKEND